MKPSSILHHQPQWSHAPQHPKNPAQTAQPKAALKQHQSQNAAPPPKKKKKKTHARPTRHEQQHDAAPDKQFRSHTSHSPEPPSKNTKTQPIKQRMTHASSQGSLPVRSLYNPQLQQLKQAIDTVLMPKKFYHQGDTCIACTQQKSSKYYTDAGRIVYRRIGLCEYCYDTMIMQRPNHRLGQLTPKGVQVLRLRETLNCNPWRIDLFPQQAHLCHEILSRGIQRETLLQPCPDSRMHQASESGPIAIRRI